MLKILKKSTFHRILILLMFLAVTLCLAGPTISDDFTGRRITAGAKIFRALLAADYAITHKAGHSGDLKLCLIYTNDTRNANKARDTLLNKADTRIRKMGIQIETIAFSAFTKEKPGLIAGIYLTQPLSHEQLKLLLHHANKKHVVVFSPFEGDVERGVHSGLAVESRVRPYLNIKALKSSGIQLKSFFIRVAQHYEK